jgi:hypothetical protein
MMYNKVGDWWYKKCKKSKFCDWIDDNILWYVWTKPREYYLDVRHWFVCNFNIYHWRLVKEAFLMHPWDGGFLLSMEERMIDKQLHWFKHHQSMVDEQYNEIMNSLKRAKYCLHVLNNETDLYHFNGESKSIPQKFTTNEDGERITVNVDNEDEAEIYLLDNSDLQYVYDGPRVNKRNAHRFLHPQTIKMDYFKEGNMDHELYMAKCRHLYYLIRERCTDLWWD